MSELDSPADDVQPPPLPPSAQSFVSAEKARRAEDRRKLMGLPLRVRDSAALLLLTLMADICLYPAWGATGGAMLLLCALAALLALKSEEAAQRSTRVGVVILAIAAVLVWSAWWLPALMAAASLLYYAVHTGRPDWSLLEVLWAGVISIFHAPPRLSGHVVARRKAQRTSERKTFSAKIILIPLAVSIMFVIVFAAANPVISGEFSKLGRHITRFLTELHEYLNMPRLLFWCLWLLVFAALIRPILRSGLAEQLAERDTPLAPSDVTERDKSDFLMAAVTLACVNVVFLGYNCVDAVYLYFKATLPVGITWTAYTHAGCGWLTFGLFLSTVVLGFVFWDKLNFHPKSPLLKQLGYAWILQNAVLAVGTLRRIHMYIDYSGLTHLLLTGVYGSLLVMAGLLIMAWKVRGNHNAVWLLRRYIAAFAIGLLVLVFTPHGWVCARYNVPRILDEKPHATWPVVLKDLPSDAMPPIIPLLDYRRHDEDTAKEKLVREGIAAILGQHLVRLEREAEEHSWSQWQASSWWALKHLRAAREKIYATAPPEQWAEARTRLKSDYDLSGAP